MRQSEHRRNGVRFLMLESGTVCGEEGTGDPIWRGTMARFGAISPNMHPRLISSPTRLDYHSRFELVVCYDAVNLDRTAARLEDIGGV